MVKLAEHKSLSHETVRRRLAENDLKPWRKTCGAFRRSMANTSWWPPISRLAGSPCVIITVRISGWSGSSRLDHTLGPMGAGEVGIGLDPAPAGRELGPDPVRLVRQRDQVGVALAGRVEAVGVGGRDHLGEERLARLAGPRLWARRHEVQHRVELRDRIRFCLLVGMLLEIDGVDPNTTSVARTLREARAAAAVVHDNVMAIHAVAEANGLP